MIRAGLVHQKYIEQVSDQDNVVLSVLIRSQLFEQDMTD